MAGIILYVDPLPIPLKMNSMTKPRMDNGSEHTAMSRLRRALEVPGLITTIMKRGYRFNADRID
jgi:DNA-binding response OmpR family regulator